MKIILKSILMLVFLLATIATHAPSTEGAVNVSVINSAATSFDISFVEVVRIKGTDRTRFTFEPTEVVNLQNIDSWKIIVRCEDDDISVGVNNLPQDICGSSVKMGKSANNRFVVTLSNPTKNAAVFTFKLKAYDKADNWLHTEKKAFRWK